MIRRAICALLLVFAGQKSMAATLTVEVRDQDGQPVSDAVVSFKREGRHDLDDTVASNAIMAQERQSFVPRVVAVQRGGSVQFVNHDATQHHVYSFSTPKVFEIPLFGKSEKPAEVFDQSGVVTVGCNIHDSMKGFVVVLDTPMFAVSDSEGVVSIDIGEASPGQLSIWHERLEAQLPAEALTADAVTNTQSRTLHLKAAPPPVRRGLGAWKKP